MRIGRTMMVETVLGGVGFGESKRLQSAPCSCCMHYITALSKHYKPCHTPGYSIHHHLIQLAELHCICKLHMVNKYTMSQGQTKLNAVIKQPQISSNISKDMLLYICDIASLTLLTVYYI